VVTSTIIVTAATYLYDAYGERVKGEVGEVTTIYIAGLYEWQASATTKYYDGGAMRRSGYASGNGVFYVLKDHLGSTSAIVSQAGTVQATDYYYPFGANRGGSAFSELTTRRFTGQYGETGLAGSEGLSYYGARWFDAQLGRFTSPDSLVPGPSDPQSFNRYTYAGNSPVNLSDPSGNAPSCSVIALPGCPGYTPGAPITQIHIGSFGRINSTVVKYKLNTYIVTARFVMRVQIEARRFGLPPQLLAASMYAEMNSHNIKDDIEDQAVAYVAYCQSDVLLGCNPFTAAWYGAKAGEVMIARDQSFGPAKIKPSAILDNEKTVPTLQRAGMSIPTDATDAAIQSLGFDRSIQFAAGYLKGLADIRKGDTPGNGNSRVVDMSKIDMQVVRVAYNEGLKNFDLKGKSFYQTTTQIVSGGIGDEVSPWLDAFSEIYGD